MPSGWEEKTLGEIGEIISGLTYSPDDVREHGLLVYRSSNIQEGKIVYRDNVYVDVELPENRLSKPGDILICVRNGSRSLIGKSALIPGDTPRATHGAFMTVLRTSEPKFVFQLLQTPAFRRQVDANLGATINSINGTDLKKYKFAFPPKAERDKIASILCTWDEAIALTEKYLAIISRLTPWLIRGLFNDCEKFTQLKNVSTVISKGTTPTTYGHNYTESGVNFLRVENITEIGTIDLSGVKYISEETHQFLQRSILKNGDVLFSIAGAIGRTAVVSDSILPANTNQAVAFIRPELSSVKSDYLRLALHLYAGGGSIEKLQAGNAQKNFNLEQVGNIKIPISSIEKQAEIIKKAKDIYAHLRVLNNYTTSLKIQKQGLMQQLLTGKKRVKV